MVETTLRQAIDGARLVQYHENRDVFVAWHGGTTFNVYSVENALPTSVDSAVHEIDVFNVADDEGRAVDRETAERHATEYLNREFA